MPRRGRQFISSQIMRSRIQSHTRRSISPSRKPHSECMERTTSPQVRGLLLTASRREGVLWLRAGTALSTSYAGDTHRNTNRREQPARGSQSSASSRWTLYRHSTSHALISAEFTSAVMKSQTAFEGGAVQEGNFDGYDVLRLNEVRQVEVHIVPSTDRPTGVGGP